MPACSLCKDPLLTGTTCPKDGGAAVPVGSVAPGYTFDRYMLDKKIGSGGMGSVWSGRHLAISRRVAIKFLNHRLIENPTLLTRFQREAQAVNEIRHKNLIDIFDFGQLPDGSPYIVMEYLEGQSLGDYLKANPSAPFPMIAHIIGQLCKALQATHDKEIIHRDLKPDNIFLNKEPGEELPFVKILDFGIAKLSAGGQAAITRPDSIFGTPAYMSPEQCQGAGLVDARADIYSLGVIVYQMITGQNPFAGPGEPSGKVIQKQISLTPPPMQTLTTRPISSSLEGFIQRALSKNPDDRPAKMSTFADELLPLLQEKPDLKKTDPDPIRVSAEEATALQASIPKTEPPKRNLSWLLPLLAIVSAVLAGVYVLSTLSSEAPTRQIKQPEEVLPKTPQTPPTDALPTISEPKPTPQPAPSPAPQPKPDAKQIHITIKTSPEPAKIFVDGKLLGSSPYVLNINQEDRDATLRVEQSGFFSKEEKVSLRKDATLKISLKKKAEPTPTPTCPTGAQLINGACQCQGGKRLSPDGRFCRCEPGTIELDNGRCGGPLDPLLKKKLPD